ncbi:hypothetical protein Xcc1_30210 [Xanthomonas campestris pv. campestris]|nr:hypothetical protein Xcc1_30210 [Xanthomonas campestris pv. campestris]
MRRATAAGMGNGEWGMGNGEWGFAIRDSGFGIRDSGFGIRRLPLHVCGGYWGVLAK